MSILLRIYFVGLIAFVPGHEQDMTVLLLDARDGYVASDGTRIESHKPLLLARAGRCEGNCTTGKKPIAEFLYRGLLREGHGEPLDLLQKALLGGASWELDDSDLAIVLAEPAGRNAGPNLRVLWGPKEARAVLPQDSNERRYFDWVVDIGRIAPDAAEINPDVLASHPQKGLVVGRLRLNAGLVQTHRLVRIGDEVRPIKFKLLNGEISQIDYSQAFAEWIVAEIPLQGCEAKIVETDLATGKQLRVMTLSPPECEEGGVIEAVILNVPQSSFEPIGRPPAMHERVGRHFEMYYELSRNPPPKHLRPVPYVTEGDAGVEWSRVHPKEESSDFLASVVLPLGRALISPPLCPAVRF